MNEQQTINGYDLFCGKFERKKTTDDCYTPPKIYDAVAAWVSRRYNVDQSVFVRPFYPDKDYKTENYPNGCVVVDNPPFSIISHIVAFYQDRGIPFFLFAPALTLLNVGGVELCHIAVGVNIRYENGATIPTSFVTNMDDHIALMTAPDLYELLIAANKDEKKKTLQSYEYPMQVITAAMAQRYCSFGIEITIRKDEAFKIAALDAQKQKSKKLFGSGYLISERAAAERAAAERWELSPREKEYVRILSGGNKT